MFLSNIEKIRAQNEAFMAGQSSWFASVNEFVDRTEEEMSRFRGRHVYAPTVLLLVSSVCGKSSLECGLER